MDPIAQFKDTAKQMWSGFAANENATATAAPRLVKFARITPGAKVLDVACGTGVVALTAARLGAKVTGIDLTPELVLRARENAAIMSVEAEWHEGDVEALPFADASFDFVVSQFGHIFAPRPDVAIAEMLRVLRPGGTVAFTTWPPDLGVGRCFALMGRYSPPPPPGVAPPVQWGDPNIVRERLGNRVRDLAFDRGTLTVTALSVQHNRLFAEANLGPVTKLVTALEKNDPEKLAAMRKEFEEVTSIYFEDNQVRQDFLMTRAIKI